MIYVKHSFYVLKKVLDSTAVVNSSDFIFRRQQGRQREPSANTLRSQLSAILDIVFIDRRNSTPLFALSLVRSKKTKY